MTLELSGKLNNFGFCLKKSDLNEQIINIIKQNFVASPTKSFDDQPTENEKFNYKSKKEKEKDQFPIFYEDNSYLVLPKFSYKLEFDIKNDILFNSQKYNKIKFNIKKISYKNIKSKFKTQRQLYDYQQLIIDHIFDHFKDCKKNNLPKGGILKLDCGAGKTVLGAVLASLLGLKTLVIVPQQPILEQWIDEFKEFSNARVGIIQGDKIDVENKDVVVAMLKSVSMKNYDQSIFKDFGLVIYDEVHHFGAKVYSKSLQKSSFEYTIGLSATPERIDDTMYVVNWNIGTILYEMQRKLNYKILIKRIMFDSISPLFKARTRWFRGRHAVDAAGTLKNLTSVLSRNELLVSTIKKLIFMDRKILILSHSLEHLSTLCAMVDSMLSKIKNNTDKNKYVDEKSKLKKNENDYKTYVYTGETKKDKRNFIRENGNIIFATIQLVEEGFNIKRLDTIVFATPVSIPSNRETNKIKSTKKLIQSIGRILRKNELDDLLQIPLVVDFADNLSIYKGWAFKRNKVYKDKKWFVQDYHFADNKYRDVSVIKNSDDNLSDSSLKTDPLKNNSKIFKELLDKDFILKNLIIKKKDVSEEFDISECIDDGQYDDNDSYNSNESEKSKDIKESANKFNFDF
jgi:superfamily II DNA or RNA helicase